MGDAADMAISDVMAMEELREEYHRGKLSDFEAYEAGIIDELGYEAGAFTGTATCKQNKVCRCCGAKNLHWEKKGNKWRLHSTTKIHNCPENPLLD